VAAPGGPRAARRWEVIQDSAALHSKLGEIIAYPSSIRRPHRGAFTAFRRWELSNLDLAGQPLTSDQKNATTAYTIARVTARPAHLSARSGVQGGPRTRERRSTVSRAAGAPAAAATATTADAVSSQSERPHSGAFVLGGRIQIRLQQRRNTRPRQQARLEALELLSKKDPSATGSVQASRRESREPI